MPAHGNRLRHIQINTYCSWLKGDRRGFRSKHHEIHSSGDYRNPPPSAERAGLRKHFEQLKKNEVTIARELRPAIGRAIHDELRECGIRVLAIAIVIVNVHAHLIVELPDDKRVIRQIIGEVKRWLTGKVWSRGEAAKPVDDRPYLINVIEYIIYDQGADAWTWCYRGWK